MDGGYPYVMLPLSVRLSYAWAMLGILVGTPNALAHGKKQHMDLQPAAETATSQLDARPVELEGGVAMTREHCIKVVGTEYLARARAILMKSCGDCHSDRTRYPWYHAVPGVGMMIDRDVAEAREHLDLSGDFPFRGHATPEEDLQALRKAVSEGSMPPWSYSLMHPEAQMSTEDRDALFAWIDESLKALNDVAEGVNDDRK